jgi:hypothetical protein
MSIAYFKRFRMEVELAELPTVPALPPGYTWIPWESKLVQAHAEVHFRSFCDEIDSALFPCFNNHFGCQHLMEEICGRPGFSPAATWIISCSDGCCGAVQGVIDRKGYGAIQNVGVTPPHRHLGLGTALVMQSLNGFRREGLGKAYLEVTAENQGAMSLYRRLGFRKMKTVYKIVDS